MRELICCLSYTLPLCFSFSFLYSFASFTHTHYGRSVSLGNSVQMYRKNQVGGCCNIWDVPILSSLSVILAMRTGCHPVFKKFVIEYICKENFIQNEGVGVSLREHLYRTFNEVSFPEYLVIDVTYTSKSSLLIYTPRRTVHYL